MKTKLYDFEVTLLDSFQLFIIIKDKYLKYFDVG